MTIGPILVRSFVRSNKNKSLIDQAELDSNPTHASIRHPDGRESTVSVCNLAPCPEGQVIHPTSTKEPDIIHPTSLTYTKEPDREDL